MKGTLNTFTSMDIQVKGLRNLLIVDYFSKFPFIRKLHGLSTGTVINELKGIFSENGIPEVIISDGGPQFRSEFRNFAQEWGFQHIQSSPYHHQSNGEAERFVRTVKDTLTKAHQSGQDPDMALLCYRSTPINSKLPSPAELMNSRRYRTLLPTWTMLKSREEEREELMSLKRKQEQYYNKSAQTLPELCTYESVCSTTTTFQRLETSNCDRVFRIQEIQSAVRL